MCEPEAETEEGDIGQDSIAEPKLWDRSLGSDGEEGIGLNLRGTEVEESGRVEMAGLWAKVRESGLRACPEASPDCVVVLEPSCEVASAITACSTASAGAGVPRSCSSCADAEMVEVWLSRGRGGRSSTRSPKKD